MSLLWPDFAAPIALWLIPVSLLLSFASFRTSRHIRNWENIIPAALHSALLTNSGQHSRRTPFILLGLAGAVAALALAQPSWHHQTQTNLQPSNPLVIALQLNEDSLATDLQPSRLHRMQQKTIKLLQLRQPALTGVVVYAGSAHTLVPLSNDLATSENMLLALRPSLMPSKGQDAAKAFEQASQLLKEAGQERGRILLMTNALSALEKKQLAKAIKKSPHQLYILGVGTPLGGPIQDETSKKLLSDTDGAILVSRLDDAGLQQFASSKKVNYSSITSNTDDLFRLGLLQLNHQGQPEVTQVHNRSSQGYWLLPIVLLLAIPLARRGWFLTLLVPLLLAPELTNAMELAFTNKQKLAQQNPQQALQEFNDPMWLGIAAYHAQDYQLAVEHFSQLNSASASYNKGNSLLLLKQYQDAIQAYQQALTIEPELEPAKLNMQLAQQLLAELPDEKPAPDKTEAQQFALSDGDNLSLMETAQPLPLLGNLEIETWLEQIPDNPAKLLKQKFWYEYMSKEAQ